MEILGNSNVKLSEEELTDRIDSYYELFPKDFQDALDSRRHYRVKDDRRFSLVSEREFDEVINSVNPASKPGTIVVEYKKDWLTIDDINECIVTRGYIELAEKHLDDFTLFIFVSKGASREVKNVAKRLSERCGVEIKLYSYFEYLKGIAKNYAKWSVDRHSEPDVVKLIYDIYSFYRYSDQWYTSVMSTVRDSRKNSRSEDFNSSSSEAARRKSLKEVRQRFTQLTGLLAKKRFALKVCKKGSIDDLRMISIADWEHAIANIDQKLLDIERYT
ncbi:MAG: hypothetical protein F6K56_31860 [Moorea sp. SIO3G5]|nr:hypothetical protein [Moorena sp. SIO3G5]